MKKIVFLLGSLMTALFVQAAQLTMSPASIPADYTGKILVTFDPTGTPMEGESACYVHTGVITQEKGPWQSASTWLDNHPTYELVQVDGKWQFTINNMYDLYCFANDQTFLGFNFVFRNANASAQTPDMVMYLNPIQERKRPEGVTEGIYYRGDGPFSYNVTLSIYTGNSKGESATNGYLLGDFSNWNYQPKYQLYKDGEYLWYTLSGVYPGQKLACQYSLQMYDGRDYRCADPYSTEVLHPDDQWVPKEVSPETYKPYPAGARNGYVTVLQPGGSFYDWSEASLNFQRPDKNNLLIYEVWVRNFTDKGTFKKLQQRLDYIQNLGVNAVELMPVTEFEGNIGWGYNPVLYFAPDKAYGPAVELKALIDECHKRGMAVILDMVFNHTMECNPQRAMHPIEINPWFNVKAPHHSPFFEDWNHSNQHTKEYLSRSLQYWLEEYKVDGFRMDVSHGLCGTFQDHKVHIHDYYNAVQSTSPGAYFILEHWYNDRQDLVNDGMLCWENAQKAWGQMAMGWMKDGDELYNSNKVGYVSYASSHDEERPSWKAKMWGVGEIQTNEEVRIARTPAVIGFLTMLKGPHMIWQFDEIAYDYAICSNSDASDGNGFEPENCYRTDEKPVPEAMGWYTNPVRMAAYKQVAQIAQLRTQLAKDIFESGIQNRAELEPGSNLRLVTWGATDMVLVAANFSADTPETFKVPVFTSFWDYLSGNTIRYAPNLQVTLQPGEIKILTTKKYDLPQVPDSYVYVGVEEVAANKVACEVYPRLVSDFVTIDTEEPILQASFVGLSGQTIPAKVSEEGIVETAGMTPGLYLLVVRFAETEQAYKIIKK